MPLGGTSSPQNSGPNIADLNLGSCNDLGDVLNQGLGKSHKRSNKKKKGHSGVSSGKNIAVLPLGDDSLTNL